jgi:malate dehydrogenase (oxaloacetate-decarboxylating)
MFYSPGVGAVCEAIQNDKNIADTMTLRGRSVAILTDGSFFKSEGKKVMPVMDWIVAQVKYYSGKDPFPFVISKDSNVE